MLDSSSQWADRQLPAERTSSRGTIFITRLKRTDRESLRAPADNDSDLEVYKPAIALT